MKKHIIMKKKIIERELNVELPADVIGVEIAPEGGAVVSRYASQKKCYCCGSTILNEKNGDYFCSKCGANVTNQEYVKQKIKKLR